MGALDILMETRARKEIADQQNRQQQTNTLLDFALGQQQLVNQTRQLDIDEIVAESKLREASMQSQLLQQFLGGSINGGLTPKSANIGGFTFENPVAVQAEEDRKVTTDARKNLDEYAGNAMQVMDALDRIETQSKELGDFGRGVIPQAVAKATYAAKKYGKDQAVTRYEGTVQRELIPLARKVAEEKGPISEFDVARLEKAFGEGTTPLEDKIFLINEIRGKLKQSVMLKKDMAKLSDKEFKAKYGKLDKKFAPKEEGNASSLKVGGTFQGKKILKVTKVK